MRRKALWGGAAILGMVQLSGCASSAASARPENEEVVIYVQIEGAVQTASLQPVAGVLDSPPLIVPQAIYMTVRQRVRWIFCDGSLRSVDFKTENPFSGPMVCEGHTCFSRDKPQRTGRFEYGLRGVLPDGREVTVDPSLDIGH